MKQLALFPETPQSVGITPEPPHNPDPPPSTKPTPRGARARDDGERLPTALSAPSALRDKLMARRRREQRERDK